MNEFKFNDFTYKLDENGNYKVDSPLKEPLSVFKYYPNNENSKDAVDKQYLFCSHPYHLNDPMDSSSILWDFSNISEKRYNSFFKHLNLDQTVSFLDDKKNNFVVIRYLLHNYVTKGSGIISLTTNPMHTLMWAHYASEKGFMIELDYKEIKNNLTKYNDSLKNYVFFPIQYVDELESIDSFQKGFNSPDIPFLYSIAVKRKDWKYESEWRFVSFVNNYGVPLSLISPSKDIIGDVERKLYYPKSAIKSITLGKNFFNGNNIKEMVGNPDTYKIKNDLEFIDNIFKNFNDRIFLSGEFNIGRKFKRSAGRIELDKVGDDIFRIIHKKEVFNQK